MRQGFATLLGAAAALALHVGPAGAQTVSGGATSAPAGPNDEGATATAEEGEILVTAQRRTERVQDIPASISAFSDATVRDAGIVSLAELAPRVPGFYFGSFGAARPQLYIRGVGTRQFDPGSEASVGVFVDEGYLGRAGGVLGSLKDIERIEVLKGPQGTLYGRNTIAGAINVITKGPTEELEAEAEAGFGNYGSYNLFAAVSGPIVEDAILARVAGWRSYSDGYVTNLTTGNKAQGTDNYGGRARLELRPGERLTISLIAEYVHDEGPSFQGESIGNVNNPNGILLARAGRVPLRDDRRFAAFYTTDPVFDRDILAFNGKVEADLGAGSLVSITTWRDLEYLDDRDFDNTSLDVIRQISNEESEQFTQELRFVSAPDGALSFGGALDWILGVYYYDDKSARADVFDYGPDSIVFPTGSRQRDVALGDYDTKSFAAFGQATINFTDTLKLTLGARWTRDRKRAVLAGETSDVLPLIPRAFSVGPLRRTFKSFDPRVALAWEAADNLNLYASYGQGFKSGGFQYISLNAAQAASVFDPEDLRAYEVGAKWQSPDRSFLLNIAAYKLDYRDIQVSRIVQLPDGSTPTLISNAARSDIRGFELEASLRPADNISFDIAYAYTDAKYDEFIFNATTDFSNTRLVRAPKHSLNFSAQWEAELGTETSLVLRADYALLSDFFHEPGQGELRFGTTIPFTREDGYGLGNVRATVKYRNFRLSGFVSNVFDTEYRRTVLALPGQVIDILGQPRTYGVSLAWSL